MEDDELDQVPTEADSDDDVFTGRRKRTASSSLPDPRQVVQLILRRLIIYSILYRALKRTKAYSTLEDVRPTLRNKPSGLKADWHRIASNTSSPRQQVLTMHARSNSNARSSSNTPSSSHVQSSSSSMLASPTIPESPLLEYDHTMSLLAVSPPHIAHRPSVPPFHGDLVPLIDKDAAESQERPNPSKVCYFHCQLHTVCDLPLSHGPCPVLTRTTKAKNNNLG
jgi:hypothetical protein